jgi:hypothetical protein
LRSAFSVLSLFCRFAVNPVEWVVPGVQVAVYGGKEERGRRGRRRGGWEAAASRVVVVGGSV